MSNQSSHGVSNVRPDTSKNTLNIELKSKDLSKLLYGNDYYKYYGVDTKFDGINARAYSYNSNIIIGLDTYYNGANSFILSHMNFPNIDNKAARLSFQYQSKYIIFNPYNEGWFNISPELSKEYIEYSRHRFSHYYRLHDDNKLFLDGGLAKRSQLDLDDIQVYSSSLDIVEALKHNGYSPISSEAYTFIHNPFTNIYSMYPDLKYYSTKRPGKSYISENIRLVAEAKESVKDTVIIENLNLYIADQHYKNKVIIYKEGTICTFKDSARIIYDNCIVSFEGLREKPIEMKAVGVNSIYFLNCEQILVNNSYFEGFSSFINQDIQLPSAITFYRSNATIINSKFENNKCGDDYINMYASKFVVKTSVFNNVLSDALDSDFSEGKIIECTFNYIGNDALDFSGSKVEVTNSKFLGIGDKAISCGEQSRLSADSNEIRDSEIAFVCKDGSFLQIRNNILTNNHLDFAIFQKKEFYEHPILDSDQFLSGHSYLIQEGAVVLSPDSAKIIYSKEVERELYGNIYGASSG